MATSRATAGTALLYLRDSEGRSDQSPVQYLPWAVKTAADLGLRFRGDEATARRMVAGHASESGDLYLDYGVSGNLLSRPGLDALHRRVFRDLAVSHVLFPRRDRYARPDNPLDAMVMEFKLRSEGVCILTLDKVLKPFPPGARIDMADLVTALFDYDAAGRFRTELAEKLTLAKIKLAEMGRSIGGEPVYGFERWLVAPDGRPDRKLALNEIVKRPGYHVLWLPTAERELQIVDRIRAEVLVMPVGQIVRRLNAEGVPSPKADRERTDKATKRRSKNSGLWTANTVKNILTHPLLIAVCEYGKRSMGDQKRMVGRSVRNLNDGDYRGDKRVTVTNTPDDRIRVPATFAPVVPPAEQAAIVAVLDERGRHLKGKSRARGGAVNPLGGRIYDVACGWPMYRNMKRRVWCYSCGLYMNSDARCCSHNLVRGEAATRFTLAAIRQHVFPAGVLEKLKARLTALAHNEVGGDPMAGERAALERELSASRHKKDTIGRNLGLAESPEQFRMISQAFEEAGREVQRLDDRLRSLPTADRPADPAAEVASALAVLGRLTEFAAAATPAAVGVGELIRGVDARLYLRFERVEQGRRVTSVVGGGIITFGSTPSPVPLYEGKTDRAIVRQMLAAGESVQAGRGSSSSGVSDAGAEVRGSGNVQRVTRRCTCRGPRRPRQVSWVVRRQKAPEARCRSTRPSCSPRTKA